MFPATTTKPSALVVEAAGRADEPDIRVNDGSGRQDIRISVRSPVFSDCCRSGLAVSVFRLGTTFCKNDYIYNYNSAINPHGIIEPNRHDIWTAADADCTSQINSGSGTGHGCPGAWAPTTHIFQAMWNPFWPWNFGYVLWAGIHSSEFIPLPLQIIIAKYALRVNLLLYYCYVYVVPLYDLNG